MVNFYWFFRDISKLSYQEEVCGMTVSFRSCTEKLTISVLASAGRHFTDKSSKARPRHGLLNDQVEEIPIRSQELDYFESMKKKCIIGESHIKTIYIQRNP